VLHGEWMRFENKRVSYSDDPQDMHSRVFLPEGMVPISVQSPPPRLSLNSRENALTDVEHG